MASAAATYTGFPGVKMHGKSIRVAFMRNGVRHLHTPGIKPACNNIKHASGLRSAALLGLKSGNYNERHYFPPSHAAESTTTSKRVIDLCERYKPLKSVDITPEMQSSQEIALEICVATLGSNRLINTLLLEGIHKLRATLIPIRAVSTVSHSLATFADLLSCCESHHCCEELGKHCVRFTKSSKDPAPLTHEEYLTLIEKGCLHPIDAVAVTVAIYTGLRPGELLAPAIEDVAPNFSKITVRRSIMQTVTFKIPPKAKKEHTVLLQPPAREAPKAQARRKVVNDYFVPIAWDTQWSNLIRCTELPSRPPYQARHPYACGNLISKGQPRLHRQPDGAPRRLRARHRLWSMDRQRAPWELEHIWEGMQDMAESTPNLLQETKDKTISI